MTDTISPSDVNIQSKYQQFLDTRLASSLNFNTNDKLISGNIGPGQPTTESLVQAIYVNLYKVHKLQLLFLAIFILIILLIVSLFIYVGVKKNKGKAVEKKDNYSNNNNGFH